ncbi:ABC transporter permease [Nakamurella endophytica]|uniref:Sugar ABC transporter permease n=1 Tax=Nakamurella endophytica TaxID=1748367 RepID=A0A917SSE3_9ACTN|nr:ABC transporter permease [Nakamurella endophytica]GGL93308.1 sugar ABC transporter permease [Nakamurella endophytica]
MSTVMSGRSRRAKAPDDLDPDIRAVAPQSPLRRLFRETGTWILVLDVFLVLLFGALSDNFVFWSQTNVQALMINGTEALLLALGLAMLLGAGAFDLSVGSNLVLSSVLGALTIKGIAGPPDADGNYHNLGVAILLGAVVCIGTGVVYGIVNGILIAYFDINSLIATLGTMGIGTGAALVITQGGDVTSVPSQLQSEFGLASLWGFLPYPALVAIVAAVVLWWLLRYTRYGIRTLALGSERTSAERAGIRVKRHLVSLAAIAGGLAGLAGFVDISRYGSTAVAGHVQDPLVAITAVVIGGTLIEGGKVSIVGVIWGTVLAIVLQTGLIILGFQSFYQLIAIGVVLIVAVGLDRYRVRRRGDR